MKTSITTADEAALSCKSHGRLALTGEAMAAFVEETRASSPWFEHYLTHPEIIIGLANGRFGKTGLIRRLTEMHAADNADEFSCE